MFTVKQKHINGDYEYTVKTTYDWSPTYEMFDGNLLVSDIDYMNNGVYIGLGYQIDEQQEKVVMFYIPEHNPKQEPEDWDLFWKNNPEPTTAEEWEKYIL